MRKGSLRAEILCDLEKKRKLVLILDFDGTLAPIVKWPAEARLDPRARRALQRLASHPQVRVAVLSGRSRRDLVQRIGIRGIALLGDHGFDQSLFALPSFPGWEVTRRELRRSLSVVRRRFPGSLVEWKPVTITAHFRGIPRSREFDFEKALRRALSGDRGKVRLRRGRKCFEVLPRVGWGKGHVARRVIATMGRNATLLIAGDDRTDEDMFRALPRAISVCIGANPSCAKHRLANPRKLGGLLEWLGSCLLNARSR